MAQTYQPLATKYRPQTFEDVVGQEVVSTTLKNALSQGRISHAYIFSGMRGVGKTTTARILAKGLNCRSFDSPTTEPCGTCDSCTEVAAGRSLDVLEIDAASNTSVDDVRSLQENLMYAPARDRYKVYIVDEVHMISKSAFNAFLKTLEEPPEHVVFIFATTELNRIPPTVLSRCLIFDFGRVSAGAIAKRLQWICEQEGIQIDKAALDLIVFQSEGSIRDAISALDQVINFADGDIEYEHALTSLGIIDREILHRLTEAVIEQDAGQAFDIIREAAATGADMRLFCRHLIRHVRDIMIVKICGKDTDLLPYSDTETTLLAEQGLKLSEEDVTRFFDILTTTDEAMQWAATPQYNLEAGVVKMIHSTRLAPLAEIISKLENVSTLSPQVAAPARPGPMKEQTLSFPQEKRPLAPGQKPPLKDHLLNRTKATTLHTFLRSAKDIRIADGVLIITVGSKAAADVIQKVDNTRMLESAVQELEGKPVPVKVSLEKAQGNGDWINNIGKDSKPAPPADPNPRPQPAQVAEEPPLPEPPPEQEAAPLPEPPDQQRPEKKTEKSQAVKLHLGRSMNKAKELQEMEKKLRQESPLIDQLFDNLQLEITNDNSIDEE